VEPSQVPSARAPGSYRSVRVLNGSTLVLEPGTYEFCSPKLGRGAQLLTDGVTTLNVVSQVVVGSGAHLGPAVGTGQTPVIDMAGRTVRVSQGATLQAAVIAPNGVFTFGRDSALQGCFCGSPAKTDEHMTLTCVP
jgi:hypothetical protein